MIAPTGQLVRIQFDDQLNERAREELLVDVRQRIRDVRMGRDGLIYLLTDEEDGALMVLKPLRPTGPGPADADNDYDEAQGTPPIVR